MSIVFGTLGHRPQSLIPSIKANEDVDRVVFYHGGDAETLRSRDTITEFCKGLRIPVDPIELNDVFDIVEVAGIIRKDVKEWKKRGNKIAVFNIAGGTRSTSTGALLACMLEGIPTVYVHDVTHDEVALPLLEMEYEKILSEKERRILRILIKKKKQKKQLSEVELAKLFGVTKATMNYHVKQLISMGAISLVPHEGDMRKKIVTLQPTIELLLGE